MPALTLDDLVANRTMSAEMAAVLSVAAAERRSFLVVAAPRLAGKTTTMDATLQHAPPGTAVHSLSRADGPGLGIPAVADGGYLRVAEIAPTGFAEYLWGPEVRRVFEALDRGFPLATSLHADSLAQAFAVLRDNDVPAEHLSHLRLVAVIRVLGDWRAPDRRALAELHEIHGVADGGVTSRLLDRWDRETDRFEQVDRPMLVGSVSADLDARIEGFRARAARPG